MTKSKAKGTRAERELKKKFEADGCYVMRSAGSHGPFDLAVFYPDRIRLVQVKVLGSPVDKDELKAIEVPECCTKEIWFKVPRRGFYGEVLE